MEIDFTQFNSLISLVNYFSTDAICKAALIKIRWSSGVIICPYCHRPHCVTRTDGRFRCQHCRRNFSCLVGTIFENTKISLRKWFMAIYLISTHKKGISSCQLSRDLQVCQKTAWYMLQKIRHLFVQDTVLALQGQVEVDEMYVARQTRFQHFSAQPSAPSIPILGFSEKHTQSNGKGSNIHTTHVRAHVLASPTRTDVMPLILQNVARGSHIVTDESHLYHPLSNLGYRHTVVCHAQKQFASYGYTSNDIELFWHHFRMMLRGIYQKVSDRYIQRYLDEAVYRWNTRKQPQSQRLQQLLFATSVKYTYRSVRT